MKLRAHVALVMLAALIPFLAILSGFDLIERRRAAERELAELALSKVEFPGAQELCESYPQRWRGGSGPRLPPDATGRSAGRPPGPPGSFDPRSAIPGPSSSPLPSRPPNPPGRFHRRPAEFRPLDEALRPSDPSERDFESVAARDLAGSLEPGGYGSITSRWARSDVQVLVRTPWGRGRCAYVLARGTAEPWLGGTLPPPRVWVVPTLVFFATVLLAVGPLVRRIRRLTSAVERATASDYSEAVTVEGRDEIASLARAFDLAARTARRRLEEKDQREKALREFLANTTHDVMIPLTVLQGHLAGIEDAHSSDRPLSRSKLVGAMTESHYIGALLHNLAATARLDGEGPNLQLCEVELGALVDRVTARHRPIARQMRVALESARPDEAVNLRADMTLIEQAVSNLVYNAIRHNRAGGHVALILEADEQDFRLRVVDDGPGLPEEDLARLMERGFRGDEARSRAPGGQGLGLDIVGRVADLHGLRFELETSTHGGIEAVLEGSLAAARGED